MVLLNSFVGYSVYYSGHLENGYRLMLTAAAILRNCRTVFCGRPPVAHNIIYPSKNEME